MSLQSPKNVAMPCNSVNRNERDEVVSLTSTHTGTTDARKLIIAIDFYDADTRADIHN